MLTPEQEAAAKAAAGANGGGSPNPDQSAKLAESLKAAQDSAEASRKEVAALKEQLNEKDAQTQEFQEKLKTFEDNMERRGKGDKIANPADLVKNLRAQAAAGNKDAIAVLEASREVAREEFSNLTMAEKMESSKGKEYDFWETKSKTHGMSDTELVTKVEKYAKRYKDELPHVRAEMAYSDWMQEQTLSTREAQITAREKELGLWKDSGTENQKPEEKKDGINRSWKDAKTPAEKRSAIGDL